MYKSSTVHRSDRVRFQFGSDKVTGTVMEDRGPIGVKGRRLYLIHFITEPEVPSPLQIELPADEFELVRDSVSLNGES